jgi:hypothetical protein
MVLGLAASPFSSDPGGIIAPSGAVEGGLTLLLLFSNSN